MAEEAFSSGHGREDNKKTDLLFVQLSHHINMKISDIGTNTV
jgi:hypothetical protein